MAKNSTSTATKLASSPLSELKSVHRESLQQLKTIFPDWLEDDLVLTLDESYGDLEIATSRILEGTTEMQKKYIYHSKYFIIDLTVICYCYRACFSVDRNEKGRQKTEGE
jgi:hypothetical protein